MCNDYRLTADVRALMDIFDQKKIPLRFDGGAIPNVPPREDIKITDKALIVRGDGKEAIGEMMRWSWPAPNRKPVFNFRSEGRRFDVGQRCLIPADGFYEFTGSKSPKTKWLFTMKDEPIFAIAGIWRAGAADGESAWSMLTCDPGEDVKAIHDRQIVVLPPDQWAGWLWGAPEAEFLRPAPSGTLEVRQV